MLQILATTIVVRENVFLPTKNVVQGKVMFSQAGIYRSVRGGGEGLTHLRLLIHPFPPPARASHEEFQTETCGCDQYFLVMLMEGCLVSQVSFILFRG